VIDPSQLEDVTPYFGERIEVIDGKRVCIPVQAPDPGALWQDESDGHYIDAAGATWMTGWIKGRHVRRRVY
jgi:hypothetical protein